MKNLKFLAFGLSFALLIIPISSKNAFAVTTKSNIKLGIDEAFSAFSIAEKEFNKGQKFQNKKDFENASLCYAKSLESWPADEAYFKLTCCLYLDKCYYLAERMTFAGLQSAKQKGDLKKHFCFLVLLAEIYSESENFKKALSIYEYLAELPMDEESTNFIEKRTGMILFEIVFNHP